MRIWHSLMKEDIVIQNTYWSSFNTTWHDIHLSVLILHFNYFEWSGDEIVETIQKHMKMKGTAEMEGMREIILLSSSTNGSLVTRIRPESREIISLSSLSSPYHICCPFTDTVLGWREGTISPRTRIVPVVFNLNERHTSTCQDNTVIFDLWSLHSHESFHPPDWRARSHGASKRLNGTRVIISCWMVIRLNNLCLLSTYSLIIMKNVWSTPLSPSSPSTVGGSVVDAAQLRRVVEGAGEMAAGRRAVTTSSLLLLRRERDQRSASDKVVLTWNWRLHRERWQWSCEMMERVNEEEKRLNGNEWDDDITT